MSKKFNELLGIIERSHYTNEGITIRQVIKEFISQNTPYHKLIDRNIYRFLLIHHLNSEQSPKVFNKYYKKLTKNEKTFLDYYSEFLSTHYPRTTEVYADMDKRFAEECLRDGVDDIEIGKPTMLVKDMNGKWNAVEI